LLKECKKIDYKLQRVWCKVDSQTANASIQLDNNSSMSLTPVSSVSTSPSPSAVDKTVSVSPSPVLPVSPPVSPPPVRVSSVIYGLEEVLPTRILFGAIWIMLVTTFVSWDAVVYGCLHFISNLATCLGLVGIFIIVSLPIVYGIIPQQTRNFKLVSLCPSIEYVFNKLDDLIAGAKQALTERM